MKVYLWQHQDNFYLINEECTMFCRPYFVSQPERTNVLKERFTGDKVELLKSVTNEDLQRLTDNSVLKWKPILPYLVEGELIAITEI